MSGTGRRSAARTRHERRWAQGVLRDRQSLRTIHRLAVVILLLLLLRLLLNDGRDVLHRRPRDGVGCRGHRLCTQRAEPRGGTSAVSDKRAPEAHVARRSKASGLPCQVWRTLRLRVRAPLLRDRPHVAASSLDNLRGNDRGSSLSGLAGRSGDGRKAQHAVRRRRTHRLHPLHRDARRREELVRRLHAAEEHAVQELGLHVVDLRHLLLRAREREHTHARAAGRVVRREPAGRGCRGRLGARRRERNKRAARAMSSSLHSVNFCSASFSLFSLSRTMAWSTCCGDGREAA